MDERLKARQRQLPQKDLLFVPARRQRKSATTHSTGSVRHPKRRQYLGKLFAPVERSFAHLDAHFLEDAKAGASDADISRWSGVAKTTVIRWRRARGIKRTPSPRKKKVAYALNLFGTDHQDVLHRVQDSPIGGVWEIPEYVIRHPLNYGEMARHLYFLHHKLGSSVELLAKAFGVRERDVQTALDVYDAFLAVNGRPCDWCELPCLKHDRYCSTECWDAAKEEMGDR